MKKYPIKTALFTKKTSIEDYYKKCKHPRVDVDPTVIREVQLYLTYACDDNDERYCKINCPVNPLPTIGWWRVPDYESVVRLLGTLGWAYQHETPLCVIAKNFEN